MKTRKEWISKEHWETTLYISMHSDQSPGHTGKKDFLSDYQKMRPPVKIEPPKTNPTRRPWMKQNDDNTRSFVN
jgi:hypothetical protein